MPAAQVGNKKIAMPLAAKSDIGGVAKRMRLPVADQGFQFTRAAKAVDTIGCVAGNIQIALAVYSNTVGTGLGND